ncbi:RNA polymerase sigma factor [Variovorax sp. Sphag1AA]|uniref:RNA polymerase sigma factor n=1 Tax=Variovorax sp. Sphag1AA TaxID=2587027 RepID=UPI001611CC3F|nr:RNA polymerase sigma factor [Variovorax sp. Sphag1AA]MBB3177844.1 RNA polymerase sigma-70 factor (ECF subfamily) [Variovorax sp. Sphag1AA]
MSHIAPTPSSPPAPEDSDAGLAARAAGGDAQAFALIMRRHNQLLFRTARSILRNDDEAEDALQEAYLRAWRAIGGFREEARLSTWLARIVINEALARLRRRGAQVIPLDTAIDAAAETGEPWEEADPDLQPERITMRQEIRNLIERRIDRLPEAYRTVFVLRAVEEMSVSETAAALQLNEATVRTRFLRARGMLREHLSRDIDVALGDAFSFAGARCDRIVAGVLARISSQPAN